jgi:hypothetical protein
LKQLLHSGWSHNPNARPSFHCIVKLWMPLLCRQALREINE